MTAWMIELTGYGSGEKILINIGDISTISTKLKPGTSIVEGVLVKLMSNPAEAVWVRETYDQIWSRLQDMRQEILRRNR